MLAIEALKFYGVLRRTYVEEVKEVEKLEAG